MSVPSNPIALNVEPDNASLFVEWEAPVSDGGSPITEYIVKYQRAGDSVWKRFFPSPRLPITDTILTVTGLINGTAYLIKVIAKNAVGISPPSATSAPVKPFGIPDRPTSVVATGGNRSVFVTWVAPVWDGGSPITDYVVLLGYASGGAFWGEYVTTGPETSFTITGDPTYAPNGLTNGTAYVVRVVAGNMRGFSETSASSAPATATPVTIPGMPTSVVAISGNSQLTVTWVAPVSTGGSPITNYIVRYSNEYDAFSKFTTFVSPSASTALSRTVTGLTNGTVYMVQVIAKNSVGRGNPSLSSTRAMAKPAATVPSMPTNVVATDPNTPNSWLVPALNVTWDMPASDGGSPITNYLVQYSTDGVTYTNVAFINYRNRQFFNSFVNSKSTTRLRYVTPPFDRIWTQKYTFKVIAVNSLGNSLASLPSKEAASLCRFPASCDR